MKIKNSTEYMIEWEKPDGYNPSAILQKLPSPISRELTEIYNYSVKPNGFYLIDRHVDPNVAAYAMKLFIDEALRHTDAIQLRKL